MRKPRSRAHRRTGLAAAVTAVAALLTLAMPATPAFAAPVTTIGITQTDAATQPSGNVFEYQLAFQCSNVDDPPGELIVLLGSVPAGQSRTIPLTVTPPNHTTPDGTTWTLAPTAQSSNSTPSSDPLPPPYQESVWSTATAALHHTITKTLDGSVFRQPGDEVTWTLAVSCSQASSGNLLAQSMTVTDTLPAGLSFVSATPAPSGLDGQTATWALPGDGDLPASCSEPGGSGSFPIVITAQVDPDFDPRTARSGSRTWPR